MRTACINVDCKNHRERFTRGLFCAICGSAIQDMPTTVMADSVDDYTVSQLIDERLHIPSGDAYSEWATSHGFHVWKPNIDYGGRNGNLESRESFALIQLNGMQIATDIDNFTAAFAGEIDVMRQVYGEHALVIEWGVIQDYY
jgi:hypothetical protein